MTKQRFKILLTIAGIKQRQAAMDLEMSEATLSRWRGRVPPYAAAYALLMSRLGTTEERDSARVEMAADDY